MTLPHPYNFLRAMLKHYILIVILFLIESSCCSSNLTILHVYSTECVTAEPQLVLEKGEEWLNSNTNFTIEVVPIPLENVSLHKK